MFKFNTGSPNVNIDSYFDRYSRFFMKNICMIISFILIIQYFTTKMYCVKGMNQEDAYTEQNCWSTGLFIYEELINDSTEAYFYGMPSDVGKDGMNDRNETCTTTNGFAADLNNCQPMKKIYFNHYQWLPFYVGLLAVIYYLPCVIFDMNNADLHGLNSVIQSTMDNKAEQISHNYFNPQINPKIQLHLKILINVFVKMLYIAVNVFAYLYTSYLLHGGFGSYGSNIRSWDSGNQTRSERLTYPGFKLLPPNGLCEIIHSSANLRGSNVDKFTMQCLMPANVLYQYALLLLWFLFVFGITISVVSFFTNIGMHMYRFIFYGCTQSNKRLFDSITFRECEYLDFMKNKDMVLYGNVIRKLKEIRGGNANNNTRNEEEQHMINEL